VRRCDNFWCSPYCGFGGFSAQTNTIITAHNQFRQSGKSFFFLSLDRTRRKTSSRKKKAFCGVFSALSASVPMCFSSSNALQDGNESLRATTALEAEVFLLLELKAFSFFVAQQRIYSQRMIIKYQASLPFSSVLIGIKLLLGVKITSVNINQIISVPSHGRQHQSPCRAWNQRCKV
jgi:hypothetical protein